jgi:hypothetical protein
MTTIQFDTNQTQFDFKALLYSLTYQQLLELEFELAKGAPNLKNHVINLKERLELQQKSVCASCGTRLDPDRHQVLTLVFGPTDFRKKGSFCGIDCHKEFLNRLEQYTPK